MHARARLYQEVEKLNGSSTNVPCLLECLVCLPSCSSSADCPAAPPNGRRDGADVNRTVKSRL